MRKCPERAPRRLLTRGELDAVGELILQGWDKLRIRRHMNLSPCRLIYIERRLGIAAKRAPRDGAVLQRWHRDDRLRTLTPILTQRELAKLFDLTVNQAKALKARTHDTP